MGQLISMRFDRGTLSKPIRTADGSIFEGHAARVHHPGDPLRYADGDEHRDAAELATIVAQLGGLAVTLGHPSGRVRDGVPARVVGRVDRAWVDGEHAAVRIRIADRSAVDEISRGVRELSLGYECRTDGARFQRGTVLDHLAIVPSARCGTTCAIRTDHLKGNMSHETEISAAASALGIRADGRDDRSVAIAIVEYAHGTRFDSIAPGWRDRSIAYLSEAAKHAAEYATGAPRTDGAKVTRVDCSCSQQPATRRLAKSDARSKGAAMSAEDLARAKMIQDNRDAWRVSSVDDSSETEEI